MTVHQMLPRTLWQPFHLTQQRGKLQDSQTLQQNWDKKKNPRCFLGVDGELFRFCVVFLFFTEGITESVNKILVRVEMWTNACPEKPRL